MNDEIDRAWRTIKALREPDPAFARVPNTVRQSAADAVTDLMKMVEILKQRNRDTDWLQMGAFQILNENEIMPSSGELIAAYKRAERQSQSVMAETRDD